MWRRAMVYLGLQDDDEEYGYDAYDYGDYPDDRRYGPPGDAHPEGDARHAPEYADVGARGGEGRDVRPVREPPAPIGRNDYTEPPARAVRPDEAPSGVSAPRQGIVRSVPTTAARVHVVEPLNFNDAQEIGDRVKE